MSLAVPKIDRARYEAFGGIISCLDPPFLAWVDQSFMKKTGHAHSPLWEKEDPGWLSAPTEVHFAVTNRCSQGCQGCYMAATKKPADELTTGEIKKILQTFRDMGVFHVALGGGEAFERDDFFEIVRYCREIGLVPNLTTHGQNIGEREIEICKMMGQVNVSIDGIDDVYGVNGRVGSFRVAAGSIDKRQQAGVAVGVNCVVSRRNYAHLGELVAWAIEKNLNEIELLKYKPSGRGREHYEHFSLTQEMVRDFYPMILSMQGKSAIELKIDCSFIPALLYHKPPVDELEALAVTGCDGGNLLLGVKSNGMFSACSFVENDEHADDIKDLWRTSAHLHAFRNWTKNAPEPCRSCEYLEICRGGCRAVALHLTGRFDAPDPECPFVFDFKSE